MIVVENELLYKIELIETKLDNLESSAFDNNLPPDHIVFVVISDCKKSALKIKEKLKCNDIKDEDIDNLENELKNIF